MQLARSRDPGIMSSAEDRTKPAPSPACPFLQLSEIRGRDGVIRKTMLQRPAASKCKHAATVAAVGLRCGGVRITL